MNSCKYTGWPSRNFPIATGGLDFIQNQILLAADYAKAAGGNYILSGCTVNGTNVSSGVLVLNGEIIDFKGGTVQTKIRITEEKSDVTAGSVTYTGAYTKRYAEFGSNVGDVDTFTWANVTAFPTNKFLLENSATKDELEALQSLVMPKGGIIMWSGAIADIPGGFALCNGQTVNNVVTPNLSGRFIIGFDEASNNLPANSTDLTQNYATIGNTGGKSNVTLTTAQIPNLTVDIPGQTGGDNDDHNNTTQFAGGDKSPGQEGFSFTKTLNVNTGGGNAHENRPPYYVLAFIMKVL
jgi:Microcystin-dependent protein